MYSGPRIVSASSAGRTTTRSSSGWIVTLGPALVAVDMAYSSEIASRSVRWSMMTGAAPGRVGRPIDVWRTWGSPWNIWTWRELYPRGSEAQYALVYYNCQACCFMSWKLYHIVLT